MRGFHFVATNEWCDGGSEVLWTRAARELRRRGHAVKVTTAEYRPRSKLVEALRAEGIPVYQFQVDRRSLRRKVRYHLSAWRQDPRFASLQRGDPSLVVISQGNCTDGLAWAEHCVETGLPFVTVAQAVRERDWLDDTTALRVLAAFGRARMNCFVSNGNKALLELQLGGVVEPSEIVFNPPARRPAAPTPWPPSTEVWRLACVGRVYPPDKGQDLLVGALAGTKWRDRPIVVNCYGEDLCTRTLSRTATRLGCEDRIRFLGHRDLATLWDDHHAFVLPSRSEGYSLAMIEAMAHGRLPIVSKVGDNEHHIRDGLNGFLLPSLTVDGMDSALEHAWQARDRWREIGLEARNTVDRVLPRDPVGYFADLLLTLCSA